MGNIRTHSYIKTAQIQSGNEPRFNLNQLFSTSTNIEVRKYPKRVIAWGLVGDETVSVHIARVQSLGNPNWTLTDDCCPCPIEPSAVANVQHMPYLKCGKPLILTADNPCTHIDDAGIYYFEYHGSESVIVDHYDDPVIRKADWCGCE